MALSKDQIKAREGKLTASRVACLMTGDADKIMALWREMIGDPSFVPEDLSSVWPVRLGEATEALNLEWFERKYGLVTKKGEVLTHHTLPWAACTLDGWLERDSVPVECKHTGGWEKIEVILDRYNPQLHWIMIVTETKRAALSVILGASEPVIEFVPFDAEYGKILMERATQFMQCVTSLTPPVAMVPVTAPIKAEKIYDMKGSNAWAAEAAKWLANFPSAKIVKESEKILKELVPADAARCHGYGVEIKRNKANALSLKEIKS